MATLRSTLPASVSYDATHEAPQGIYDFYNKNKKLVNNHLLAMIVVFVVCILLFDIAPALILVSCLVVSLAYKAWRIFTNEETRLQIDQRSSNLQKFLDKKV